MRINVLDYPTPADAFAAARDGDGVYFPGTQPYTAPVGGWAIAKSLEICGDSDGSGASGGSILNAANDPNSSVFVVISAPSVYIHDLRLVGPGGLGTGSGISCQPGVEDLRVSRITVVGFAGHGIHLAGTSGTGTIRRVLLLDSTARDCAGAGVRMDHTDDALMMGCMLEENQKSGLAAAYSSVALYHCGFDGNSLSSGLGSNDGSLSCDHCSRVRVDACRFVNFNAGPVRKACVLASCDVSMVDACFLDGGVGSGRSGVVVTGTGTGPAVIMSNRFKNVDTLVRVDVGARGSVVFPQYDESAIGTIVLPEPNEGMFGATHIRRPSGTLLTGLIVPSSATDPTANLQDGMLAYNTVAQRLGVYQGGLWLSIETI